MGDGPERPSFKHGVDAMGDGFAPTCIASTRNSAFHTVAASPEDASIKQNQGRLPRGAESNCFRSATWSADGTTVITHNEDWRLRTFVLSVPTLYPRDLHPLTADGRPTDLLDPSKDGHLLNAYSISSPVQCHAHALYPLFALADTGTTLLLQSRRDLPVRLTNALDLAFSHATYSWINPTTEAYIAPHSLAFSGDGTHFVAGAKEQLAVFDVSRDGEGPVTRVPTRMSKRARKVAGEPSVGLGGLVTALAMSSDGTLAAGTTGGQVGLWAGQGLGDSIASLSLRDDQESGTQGSGVMQLSWSPCGRYLFVAERLSDALFVYDIRGSSKRLGWLRGRKAKTTQPLQFDVVQCTEGKLDIWAGGTDGMVRVWEDVTGREGAMDAQRGFLAHNDTITSTAVHPCQTILATCSGKRLDPQAFAPSSASSNASDGELDNSLFDNSLKVWNLAR